MLQAIRLSVNKTTLHLIVQGHHYTATARNAGLHWSTPDLWPSNSPDLNQVDYKVWGVMQDRVHECRMNSVDELKLRLVDVWNSLQQNVIDAAINEWRKRLRQCMHADEQHVEHLLSASVTDKSYGQIKSNFVYSQKMLLYC